MMDCSSCDHWNQGRGKPLCLKCKKYKELQLKSVRRETIKTEHLPQAVMENIADPRTRTLFTVLQQLPSRLSVPLMMRLTLNMTLQEIADYHHIARPNVHRKISQGIELIKQSLLGG
jgi:DNA-directed RNA polymerase specialized sigma24 family protein